MSDIFTPGFKYKKFKVVNVFEVSDYHSKAVHLRHEVTGLEVVHLFNDDTENLFAFAFRTPNDRSNGAAHIIEHSVLCGSEKFPLKDPFVNLTNQSVKTYLNAMTYPDKTIYPGSSIARQDYFNLMNVYGDAVFFPKLQKEIFQQEAHRLEVDSQGNVSIQGVVYNEMKGNYSSFDSVANDAISISLLRDSVYQKDSGGDPLEIPSLTYDDFVEFHSKWYRPDNCLVFLYGNIETEVQLDYIQDNFLDRLESRNSDYAVSEELRKLRLDEFLSFVKVEPLEEPAFFEFEGPAGDSENESTVLVNWDLGTVENSMKATEAVVLACILANHDGSPLQKALMDSGLGEDTAPQSGFSTSFYDKIFTIGLRGVKKQNARKIEKLLLDTIESLLKNGISRRDIDAALMGMEISQRDIKRGSGPFSIALMNRIVSGWLYGHDISRQIKSRKDLELIKNRINGDENYLPELIRLNFLENKARTLCVVTPSRKYSENRKKAEDALIKKLMESRSIEEIKKENERLHEFQQTQDDDSCLPHLKPSDFMTDGHPLMNRIDIKIEEADSSDGKKIPFMINEENTNGMVYMELGFPVDTLSCEEYALLPLFSNTVTECGWQNLDWAMAAEETALHTGGLTSSLLTMEGPSTERAMAFKVKYGWTNRDWLIFRTYMIEEETENAMNLLSDCVTGACFGDLKRLRDLVNESKNDYESSILPDGHVYVSSRVCSSNSRTSAVDEIWNGLTQLSVLKKTAKKSDSELAEIFRGLLKKIRESGSFIHITAEKNGVETVRKALPDFISKTKIVELKEAKNNSLQDFIKVIDSEFDSSDSEGFEIFTAETQVGFAARTIPASPYGTRDCAAEDVCTHWLSNNLLWEKIRTIGGAYGAFCNTESFSELITFATYRDPSPVESCDVFIQCLEECSEMTFSHDEIEKAIMGCYSHFIQPQTPKGRGATAMTRALYGICDDDREQKIKWLLELDETDIQNAFVRLYRQMKNPELAWKNRKAVICSKNAASSGKKTGKIIGLNL